MVHADLQHPIRLRDTSWLVCDSETGSKGLEYDDKSFDNSQDALEYIVDKFQGV